MKLKLTPERERIIREAAEEYTAIGLCTDEANWGTAEAAVQALYASQGFPAPKLIRATSPLVAELMLNLGATLGATLRANLGATLGANLWDNLGANLGDNLGANLWDNLGANLGANLRANLRDNLWDNLGDKKLNFFGTWFYGSWDYMWPWFDGGRRVGWRPQNAAHEAALDAHMQLFRSCGWLYLYSNVAIICDRPRIIHQRSDNRLHCQTGPALAFADGCSVYAVNGVRVPAHWVEQRATIDPAEILKASNVEQRAAGAALIGWPRMLQALQCKVIDDSGSDDIGQLIELTLPGLRQPGRFLKALCPRNGLIVEGVPRMSDVDNLPIETALHAQAWRIGDKLSEYQHPPRRT